MKKSDVHVELNDDGIQDLGQEVTEKMLQNGDLTYPCPNCGTTIILKSSVAICPKCGFKLGTKIGETITD